MALLMSFINPQLYRILTHGVTNDIPTIQKVVRASDGPVLDVGAGLGRVSTPLLTEGYPVVMLDHSVQMCDELLHMVEHQSHDAQQKAWILHADITTVQDIHKATCVYGQPDGIPTRFASIILSLRTIHLFSDLERTSVLEILFKHLQPDGTLIIHHSDLTQVVERKSFELVAEHSIEQGVLEIEECFFHDAPSQQYHLRHRIHQSNDTGQHVASWRVAHNLTPIDKLDLQQQLAEVGFTQLDIHPLYGTESFFLARR